MCGTTATFPIVKREVSDFFFAFRSAMPLDNAVVTANEVDKGATGFKKKTLGFESNKSSAR